jgi:mRNA interferase MazF
VVIWQGEVWWADLPAPEGFGPGFRRPVVVVQGDAFNLSRIVTVVCVPLTSNLRWVKAPGNVLLLLLKKCWAGESAYPTHYLYAKISA